MISGPILPQTREGLWAVLDSHLERIESGLRLLEREPLLGDLRVDALCRDAAGTPVLLFVAEPGQETDSLQRAFRARLWMLEHGRLLPELVPLQGLEPVDRPRCLLVGFDFPWSLVQLLPKAGLPGLEVYAVRSLTYGGQLRVRVVPVHGPACEPPARAERAPEGIACSEQRAWFARLHALLRRLDPDLVVRGDRFARRWFHDGALLAEVGLLDQRLCVRLPSDGAAEHAESVFVVAGEEDCRRAADRVARRYLELLARRPTPGPASGEDEDEPSPRRGDGVEAGAGVGRAAPHGSGLDRLRSTITEAQLTREEFLALGGALLTEAEGPDVDES